MPGLEVLYTHVSGIVSCPQDALVCFVHWEIIQSGYKCLGSGDEPRPGDKLSELLPPDWSSSKELYTLRYQSQEEDKNTLLLVKAILVDNTLIFMSMESSSSNNPLSDLAVTISDHVDADHLQTYDRVFKDATGLSEKVRNQLLPPVPSPRAQPANRKAEKKSRRDMPEDVRPDSNVYMGDPMAPFATGGAAGLGPLGGRADLDPLGGHGGGMIVDPLRAGVPRLGFDPLRGLPPGAVPPGARFDPFGPLGWNSTRPDPDHLPPPGFDDMFM